MARGRVEPQMSQEKKNTSFLVYLLLIPAIVGGFALIRDGWKEYEFGQETASWAKTTGTILKKGVLDSDRSGRHEFTPRVTYTYDVGGRTHEGHVISRELAGRYPSRREAEAQIEAFEPGADVDVYYDPDSPSRSCLVPGDHGDGIAFMLTGAGIVAIALFIISLPMLKGYLRRQFVDRRLNIALKAPWGWRRLPASGSSGPLVAFARKHIRCALNAAAADRDVLPSADTVATQRLDIIAEYSTSHEVLTREPALIDGREGVLIEVTARENKSEFLYTGFCMAHRGFRRELLVYGKKKSLSRRQARETLEEFVRRLQVLEPERFSYQALPPVTKPFVSKIYGYRFTPRKGWRRWRTVSSDLPDAEAGFLHDRGLVLSLLPVALPDGNPPREAVVAGLLTLYEVDDSDPTLTPLPHSSNRLAYRFERTVGETAYAYRFHFDFWQGVACMAAVAGEADNPFLDEVM
ncbi:MAG TPA: DUF3592 domain-containing protein, partial [Planctomycetes bacterium]|nr:DUF3592 domain-containing protein [Planctomycetota bacterium]